MRLPSPNRLICAALLGLGVLTACDVVVRIRVGETLNGCFVRDKSGEWGPGELEYSGTLFCPIGILNPGERVVGEVALIDRTQQYRYLRVDIDDSFGRTEFEDEQTVQIINGEHAFSMIVDYAAATGRNQVGDYDVLSMDVYRGDFVSYMELELTTAQDNGLAARFSGSAIPLANSSQTWHVGSHSGGRPHQFEWYRDGQWVASGGKYTGPTGTTDFQLRVNTRDALGRTATSTMWVDVDGVRASISGPTLVYASQGGGDWTVTGQGGYEPYSFDWYLDGNYVTSGPSFGGYTGEGTHMLRVDMRDSRGATHSADFHVEGIGNNTCEPVPPAVTC